MSLWVFKQKMTIFVQEQRNHDFELPSRCRIFLVSNGKEMPLRKKYDLSDEGTKTEKKNFYISSNFFYSHFYFHTQTTWRTGSLRLYTRFPWKIIKKTEKVFIFWKYKVFPVKDKKYGPFRRPMFSTTAHVNSLVY